MMASRTIDIPGRRSVEEWIGTTPDSAIPPRVRMRVFIRDGGKCCGCGRKLTAGDKQECDHIVAIVNGGQNRESNLQTLCSWCHKPKTARDVASKAKADRTLKKHLGIRPPSRFPGSKDSPFKKKLDGTVVRREAR